MGGEGWPAPDSNPALSGTGHIPCVICLAPISLQEYRSARCWTDPQSVSCAAHHQCLIRIGERELHLPPDPGETTTATHGIEP